MEQYESLYSRGLDYIELGQYHRAIECFDKIISNYPLAHKVIYAKGLVLHKLNCIQDAIDCYEKAIDISPGIFIDLEDCLGNLYFENKQYQKAKYWLRKYYDNQGKADKIPNLVNKFDEILKRKMVFISYPHKNEKFIDDSIIPIFNNYDIDVWFDRNRIPEENLEDGLPFQLQHGIGVCETILIIWSKFTSSSKWMVVELCTAISLIKNIVILIIDDSPVNSFIEKLINKGKIKSFNFNKSFNEKEFINSIKNTSIIDCDVIMENLSVKTFSTFHEDIEFEWIELNGGILDNYSIGKYPVTQRQWERIMGFNPSKYQGDENRPVENISWYDTQDFISKLNCNNNEGFRLLSDIEWEFACRAGNYCNYSFGDKEQLIHEYAWYMDNTGEDGFGIFSSYDERGNPWSVELEMSPNFTNSVYSKKPNRWGIYHMHGNVYEWCNDDYLGNKKHKIIRGGAFNSGPRSLRCSSLDHKPPSEKYDNVGFRLCRKLN